MKRLKMLVEGQSEERFVVDMLRPYLATKGIVVERPIITWTSRDGMTGQKRKGGVDRAHGWDRIRDQMAQLMMDEKDANCLFGSMFDFYGFPQDMPLGARNLTEDHQLDVKMLEEAFKEGIEKHLKGAFQVDFVRDRFLPFIMLHEFETFIFADLQALDWEYLEDSDQKSIDELKTELARCGGVPESVNSGIESAPSKRILRCFPDYDKVSKGNNVISHIGMEKLLQCCPHFKSWIDQLIARV